MEMERQRREDIAALIEEGQERQQEAMQQLSPLAIKLHINPLYSSVALGVLSILTLIGLPTSIPLWFAAGALYAVDWHNVTTLHGKINWSLFRYTRGNALYWLAVCGLALFCFVPAAIYLIQCLSMREQVKQIERAKMQAQIAQLEQQVLPAAQQRPSQQPE
jgi:hypothetical protein